MHFSSTHCHGCKGQKKRQKTQNCIFPARICAPAMVGKNTNCRSTGECSREHVAKTVTAEGCLRLCRGRPECFHWVCHLFAPSCPPRVTKSIRTPRNTSRCGTLRIVGTGLANVGWWRSPRWESTRTSTTTLSQAPVGLKVKTWNIFCSSGGRGLKVSWPFFDVGR